MLLRRSVAPDPRAAARVAALLEPAAAGGWQPPPVDDEPHDVLVEDTLPAEDPLPAEPPPDPHRAAVVEQSWSAFVLPATLRGGRLDPGLRGVAALVLVAVVAAVGTGVVVLRGRPQEVVVPDGGRDTPLLLPVRSPVKRNFYRQACDLRRCARPPRLNLRQERWEALSDDERRRASCGLLADWLRTD